MTDKLKLGVIGLGNIFRHVHEDIWNAHPEVELYAVSDSSPAYLERFAGVVDERRRYADYHDLLADPAVDIVDICAPNWLHAEISIAALKAGKHVLCEKPDAIRPEDAETMAEEARRSGKIMMTMRNNRFRPVSAFLKKYVDSGRMGAIYMGKCGWIRRRGMAPVGWFTNRATAGGGPLLDLGVHYIDLAVWLMGGPKPVAVSGAAYYSFGERHLRDALAADPALAERRPVCDIEDLAAGWIRFDNGAILQIEFSWASHIEEEKRFLELRGTEAGFSLIDDDLKLFMDIAGVPCDIRPKLEQDGHGHSRNIAHFVDCVRGRAEPLFVPEEGVDMVRILHAIYESAQSGREVRL